MLPDTPWGRRVARAQQPLSEGFSLHDKTLATRLLGSFPLTYNGAADDVLALYSAVIKNDAHDAADCVIGINKRQRL